MTDENLDLEAFARNLRRIMTEKGVGPTALEALSGVKRSTIHSILAGTSTGAVRILAQLAAALGVSSADLLAAPPKVEVDFDRLFDRWQKSKEARLLGDVTPEEREEIVRMGRQMWGREPTMHALALLIQAIRETR